MIPYFLDPSRRLRERWQTIRMEYRPRKPRVQSVRLGRTGDRFSSPVFYLRAAWQTTEFDRLPHFADGKNRLSAPRGYFSFGENYLELIAQSELHQPWIVGRTDGGRIWRVD